MTRIADPLLAPCPFCGSPASLEHDSDHHGEWFNLGCSKHWEAVADDEPSCPAGRLWYTAGLDEEAGAIEAWNRRSALIPPSRAEPVATLVTALERIAYMRPSKVRPSKMIEQMERIALDAIAAVKP